MSELERESVNDPTPLERLREMKRFVNEYKYATGGVRTLKNLPDPSQFNAQTVTMPLELLVRFRNDYLLMIGFVAHYCNVLPDQICPLTLLAPFLKDAMEDNESDERFNEI